jgi:uncharacterized membrane protein (DUF4010 family)
MPGVLTADLDGVALDVPGTMGQLALALAVGLLVGLQREFAKQAPGADLFAGARSFALIGLAGGVSAVLSRTLDSVLPFVTGFVVVGAVVVVGYLGGVRSADHGSTTEIAAIVTYLAGSLAGFGELALATALGVATTAVLAVKPYTREFVSRLERRDVEATVQFAVLAALILPVLPREPYGPAPFDAASAFSVGLMVMFIMGLSFVGYVAIKLVGPRLGIGLTGILGGMVSSTAVTLTMSERSKSSEGLLRVLAMAMMLAWTIMYGRVLVEIAVVNAELLAEAAVPVAAGGAVVLVWAVVLAVRRPPDDDGDPDHERFENPFSIRPALQFGLLYGAVLIGSKALSMYVGDAGVYAGAVVSGLTDVDAITLSMAELSKDSGEISDPTAANAIVLAAASNTLVKGGLVWALGAHALRGLVTPPIVGAVVVSVGLTFIL